MLTMRQWRNFHAWHVSMMLLSHLRMCMRQVSKKNESIFHEVKSNVLPWLVDYSFRMIVISYCLMNQPVASTVSMKRKSIIIFLKHILRKLLSLRYINYISYPCSRRSMCSIKERSLSHEHLTSSLSKAVNSLICEKSIR